MSLVADYSSDVSSSDEDFMPTALKTETLQKTSISSLLPPPKTISKNKKDGPVKIVVDLPSQVDDLEEEENVSKKQRISTSNSLLSLLPAPKRTITNERKLNDNRSTTQTTAKTTTFVPHTITKKKPITKSDNPLNSNNIEAKQLIIKNEDDTEEANAITESFFPLGPEITNIKSINETKDVSIASITTGDSYASTDALNTTDFSFSNDEYASNEYYNDGQWQENANAYVEYQGIYDESHQQIGSEQTQSNWELDDEMFQKLGGRRGKKEGPIKIKEINAADQMADAWQSQVANLSKPTRGSGEGSGRLKPTRGQKRKHNLMYLAFQATSMESEMKEQHATNRKTKRETQAKYDGSNQPMPFLFTAFVRYCAIEDV
ncbi:11037_t:CDS:2, partial [Scutellospora calospora]